MAKKVLLLLIFISSATESIFAQNNGADYFGFNSLNTSPNIFDFQKNHGFNLTNDLDSNIPPLDIPAGVACVVNILAGLGIGSYLQGDTLGGTIGVVGEFSGMGLIAGGTVIAYNGGSGVAMIIGGAVLFLGTKIFEIIRPWKFG